MVRRTNWIGMGLLSAVLAGIVAIGCDKQSSSNPDTIPGTPATAVTTPTPVPPPKGAPVSGASSPASAGSFDDAANTWRQVEAARAALDTAIKERKRDKVHEAASRIHTLVQTLPDQSAQLPDDKRKTLEAHVKNVGELTAMMDDPSGGADDVKSVQEHQTALNDALDMMKGVYPAEALRAPMHMPAMNSSGNGLSDTSMSDNKPSGKPMSDDKGPSDKMPGTAMGKPAEAGNMSGMPDANMADDKGPGRGMMGKMGKMGGKPMGTTSGMGMGMMDKMMSGMSAMDQREMTTMMEKMAAMPPADRKKAMRKMSGMGKPSQPGKQADPKDAPMPGGGMSDM